MLEYLDQEMVNIDISIENAIRTIGVELGCPESGHPEEFEPYYEELEQMQERVRHIRSELERLVPKDDE